MVYFEFYRHPYNPLKSLVHLYKGSPTGSVTLTRSTVLLLSGWSNTQFSYWARRAEAISVLGQHDERLRAVGNALERRLRGESGSEAATTITMEQGTSHNTGASSSLAAAQEEHNLSVTGKGLDIIIDEVKKRTGASQFLRGKHSSLDPYGSTNAEGGLESLENGIPPPAPVFNATFQALEYTHSPPPPALPSSGRPQQQRVKGRRGSKAESQQSNGRTTMVDVEYRSAPHLSFTVSDSRAVDSPSTSTSTSTTPSLEQRQQMSVMSSGRPRRAAAIKCPPIKKSGKLDVVNGDTGGSRRELQLPVSDSRSELEGVSQKRNPHSSDRESPPKKRLRQLDT